MTSSTGSFSKPITAGDTWYLNLSVTADDGNPLDITGYEFFFTAKTNPSLSDECASIYKTQSEHTDPVQGKTSILVLPSETSGSVGGKYYFDIRMKDQSGNITTLTNSYYFLNSPITINTDR